MSGQPLNVSRWVRSREHLRLRLAQPDAQQNTRHFSRSDDHLLPWLEEELSSLHFTD